MDGYFLAIGELLADMITVDYAAKLGETKTFQIFQGGSPANLAANIKYLGKEVELVSCVGNDGIGHFLIRQLKSLGISGDHIQISNDHPTSIVLVTKSKGTPDFIAYREADTHLMDIQIFLIEGAGIVHTTAFALSKEPARGAINNAVKSAQRQNKMISIDWNYATEIWKDDVGKDVFENLMNTNPLLKISVDDLERFIGKKLGIDDCKVFLDKYLSTATCLTCGSDGVWYKERRGEWQFKKAFAVKNVRDTTGAGDAFWAGFITAYMDELKISDCIVNGLAIAARKIEKGSALYF